MSSPTPKYFHRLFVANRGEVAVRIARACDALGIVPVLALSAADSGAAYARGREQVVLGPARAAQSYLDASRVVQAAVQSGCTALHPGWGFLAENPLLAALCEQHGVTFVGPPAHVMSLMGKKTPAKRTMAKAGLAVIPGSDGVVSGDEEAARVAETIGYPILIKAEAGGGGRGMRVARAAGEVGAAFAEAQAEALTCFGDSRVYLEKLLEGGRHVEVQVLADHYGNVIHLGERDCTVQRNHQKLIEESPAPGLDSAELARTLAAAVSATAEIGYVGAGTMEFLLDESGTLRFMEMNTRLQVEHSVSELRSGFDIVSEQIRIAAGAPLSVTQADIELSGHAIECRINAEDPADGFRPGPGKISVWRTPPEMPGELRVDTHIEAGETVSPHYDSLLCKLIARGSNRERAIERMLAALKALECRGVPTTVAMHEAILSSPQFKSGDYDTRAIPGWEQG